MNNEELLESLKKELIRINSTVQTEYDTKKQEGHFHSTSIMRRLNLTWREIVKEIDLKPARYLNPKNELLADLKEEFKRIGSYKKSTYIEKRNKKKFPNPRFLTKHLGMNWLEITRACGRENVSAFKKDQVTDEQLIDEYKRLSKRNGKPLTVRELQSETAFSYDIYRQHFGTIGELRKASGFKEKTKNPTPIVTKEDCIKELQLIHDKHGQLSYNLLKEKSNISLSTIFRKFHTTKITQIWKEVLK